MSTVRDVLDAKGRNVWWIDPLASVYEAFKMMQDRNVSALLVMIDGTLVGIVSERDYVRKVILDHKSAQQLRISEIMTHDVIKVGSDDSVEHCIELMRKHHIRHLPVVDDGEVVGILSLRDLFFDVIERLGGPGLSAASLDKGGRDAD